MLKMQVFKNGSHEPWLVLMGANLPVMIYKAC